MEFKVTGMSCEGCVGSVQRIVARNQSLDKSEVIVELASGKLVVPGVLSHDQVESLREALNKQGFKLHHS